MNIDIVNLYLLTFAPRMPPRMNIFKLLLSSPKNHRNSSAAEVVPAKREPIGALGFGRCGSSFFLLGAVTCQAEIQQVDAAKGTRNSWHLDARQNGFWMGQK